MLALPWYVYLMQFVAGLFLANGVPHFVQGISGHWFETPFASPPGVGESSPVVLRRERIGIGRRTFGVSDTRGIPESANV